MWQFIERELNPVVCLFGWFVILVLGVQEVMSWFR